MSEKGTYQKLMDSGGEFFHLISAHVKSPEEDGRKPRAISETPVPSPAIRGSIDK